MFDGVIVANRGAVAARVLRALNAMRIHSIAVYSESNAGPAPLQVQPIEEIK